MASQERENIVQRMLKVTGNSNIITHAIFREDCADDERGFQDSNLLFFNIPMHARMNSFFMFFCLAKAAVGDHSFFLSVNSSSMGSPALHFCSTPNAA